MTDWKDEDTMFVPDDLKPEQPSPLFFLLVLVAALILGAGIGTALHAKLTPRQAPPVPEPTVTVTVIKTVPGPTKTVSVARIPGTCRDLVNAALKSQQAVTEYEGLVGKLPDLIDDAGVAIATQNNKKLNDLRQQDVKLEADSIQALLDMRDAQQRMQALGPKCAADMKKD